MNIIVFGASGGTGIAVVEKLLEAGDLVTAFVRNPARFGMAANPPAGLTIATGDAMNADDVAAAMPSHDSVVVTLGNSQNPFAMLLGARRTTPANICETGTRHVIAAMNRHAIRRLVCVSAFGIGETKPKLPLMFRIFYKTVLRKHMADKERMEVLVKASGLDWTLAQPVGLTDQAASGASLASSDGVIRKQTISRADVAAFIGSALHAASHLRQTVALSG